MIEKSFWGNINDTPIYIYRITNSRGHFVDLLNYGAAVHRIFVPDRDGVLKDVVLGAKDEEAFLTGFTGEGICVGRCANRIANGQFELNGKTYQLEINSGTNCIHSGSDHYGRKVFCAAFDSDSNIVHFYHTDEGKSGFNSRVHVSISYTWTNEDELIIDYDLLPEEDTILSPTNHSYFNLDQGDVRDLVLWINADMYAPRTANGLPEGDIIPVEDTAFDFRAPAVIGERIQMIPGERKGFDDNLILNGEGFRKAAVLHSRNSGRTLSVYTDMPGIVLFCGGPREPVEGKDGRRYGPYCFVCLETQYISNAINCPSYKSPAAKGKEHFLSRTVFAFSVDEAPLRE